MRKERDSKVAKEELIFPFDVTKFGSEEDPCFGKLYDLTEPECQACGDHELCGISFMAKLKQKRIAYESDTPVKDLKIDNLELGKEVKDFYRVKITQGFTDRRIKSMINKKFHIHQTKIEEIMNG
jgi:hypothetical protein